MPKNEYLNKGERRGYQWPASALTGNEMEILADWRERTGVPISELLRQTVAMVSRIEKRNPLPAVTGSGSDINPKPRGKELSHEN